MANTEELQHWLTKSVTAAELGISERSLDRLNGEGKPPQRKYRQRPGKRPEPVYNPDDVAMIQAAANPPRVLPPIPPEMATTAIIANGDGLPPGLARGIELIERVIGIVRPNALAAPKLFLTIDEAAEYSGLSRAWLRRAIRDQALPSLRDRSVKIRRADLDAFAHIRSVEK